MNQVYDDTTGKDEQIGEGLVDWGGEDGQVGLSSLITLYLCYNSPLIDL